MNIKEFHDTKNDVSAFTMFKSTEGKTIAIEILEGKQFKEHMTQIPALLVCVNGKVVFEDEKGFSKELKSGDFVKITPFVKHWVNGIETSQLLLMK